MSKLLTFQNIQYNTKKTVGGAGGDGNSVNSTPQDEQLVPDNTRRRKCHRV